ncbi:MAG: rhomboid family intramembrane serine protease [Planctomycetaceae bacterium]
MGIENREYLRDEYDGPGPMRFSTTSVQVKLIIVTVAVFLLQVLTTRGGDSVVTRWLDLSGPDLYQHGQVWRLLTYAFCHNVKDPFHLIFNMMTLYFAADTLLRLLGQKEFLWFYCCSAMFAGFAAVVTYTIMGRNASVIGASGAVCAMFGLVTMHYPRQRVMLMGLLQMEMRWVLAIFMLLPVLIERMSGTPVSHSAHFGGLLFGYLYFKSHMQLSRWWDNFAGRMAMKRRNKGKLKIFAPPAATDSNLDAQMDPILEKISREGEASLTQRERNILIQASKKLRKDRN